MPKAYLSFKLPEDEEDFALAFNGWRYKQCLNEFCEYLRGHQKYLNNESIPINEVRDKLVELMAENGVL